MDETPDQMDQLAAAYIGLWRDYMAKVTADGGQMGDLPTDPAALVNAGAEAWQSALSAYGDALKSSGLAAGAAPADAASDDRDAALRQLHERLSALEARIDALENGG